jgi:hypothetical protein
MTKPTTETPQLLAQLISLAGDRMPQWLPDDLAAMWRHQLSAPLEYDLAEAATDARTIVTQFSSASDAPLRTFGNLLRHPSPPLDLLRFTKDFAKARRAEPDAAFPQEIATALYYAAIAVALVRQHQKLTELDPQTLCQGLQWTAQRTWMDSDIRDTLNQALSEMPPA